MNMPTIEQVWSHVREHRHRGVIVIVDDNNREARESAIEALVTELRRNIHTDKLNLERKASSTHVLSTECLHTFSPRESK